MRPDRLAIFCRPPMVLVPTNYRGVVRTRSLFYLAAAERTAVGRLPTSWVSLKSIATLLAAECIDGRLSVSGGVQLNFWLMKSEPTCFSIQHLARSPHQTTCWSGVRNYQARNFMREMQRGDLVLFHHSNAEPPAVVGTAEVVREAYPDPTALDPHDDHFDPKATIENPIWQMVDIRLQEIFPRPLAIEDLRALPALKNMELLRKGSRLSVQAVTKAEFELVLALAHAGGKARALKSADKLSKRQTSRSAAQKKKLAR